MALPSTSLKRPDQKLIDKFRPDMVDVAGANTVGALVDKGFSLVICCKACPRMVEWSPADLEEKFADRLGLRLFDLVPRLTCSGPEGCGHKEVAVFPHFAG